MSHRLAVCILARNEAHHIGEAIDSVKSIADVVLVTDTGSTDDTIAIAEERGALVDSWLWRDDFAAGWNHLQNRAKPLADWTLVLDADERLSIKSQRHIRKLIEKAPKDLDAFLLQRQDLVDLKRPDDYTETTLLRLFRLSDKIRFIGRCHPHLVTSQAKVQNSGLTLIHLGYLSHLLPAKAQRGKHLLELELKDRPGQLYYLTELYRTQILLADPNAQSVLLEAAKALAPDLNRETPRSPHLALLFEALVQLPASQLPPPLTPPLIEELCDRWFPTAAPLYWTRARLAFQREDYPAARDQLIKLTQLAKTKTYSRHASFDPAILSQQPLLNLAACHIKLGELSQAQRLLRPLKDHPELGPAAKANLTLIQNLKDGFA